jgi:uncharacterized membrane protein
MSGKDGSRRSPLVSALLFAILYLVISSAFYRVYHGRFYFEDFYLFNWFEFALGAIIMAVAAGLQEAIRNRIGRS